MQMLELYRLRNSVPSGSLSFSPNLGELLSRDVSSHVPGFREAEFRVHLSARVTRSRRGKKTAKGEEERSGMSRRAPPVRKGEMHSEANGRGERDEGCRHWNIGATESARVRHKQSAIVDYGSDIARRVSAHGREGVGRGEEDRGVEGKGMAEGQGEDGPGSVGDSGATRTRTPIAVVVVVVVVGGGRRRAMEWV